MPVIDVWLLLEDIPDTGNNTVVAVVRDEEAAMLLSSHFGWNIHGPILVEEGTLDSIGDDE